MILINYSIYRITKSGNRDDENEDAVEIYRSRRKDVKSQEIRCAISDGATQTSFSSIWARLLVKEAIRFVPSSKRFCEITKQAQTHWAQELLKINLPWHAEEKAKKGAFATLLWISIKRNIASKSPGGIWKAIAIGDSNLIIVRDNRFYFAFPIKSSQDFNNSPFLICSVIDKKSRISEFIKYEKKDWLPGDQFLIMTDALAQFILYENETGGNPFLSIAQLSKEKNSHLAFKDWIQSLRAEHRIRNDDTTLVHIRLDKQKTLLGKEDDFSITYAF